MVQKKKKIKSEMKTIQHPLFSISFKNWVKILCKNGGFDL